ncbi:MAG: alpha-amylase [Streptococcaceae bacterium]|jgi:alpha-amylase|nr:alpha-amylase [Streptococcaceae bacterium]
MRTILQAFEWYLPADGRHWQHLTEKSQELANFGFTGLWLPPASKAASGKDDVGYGIYDFYDLGEFDQKGTVPTKYGTKTDYLSLIQKLHEVGIEAYADIVFDHLMGADGTEVLSAEVEDFNNRLHQEGGPVEVEVWTKFTFLGRAGKYNDYQWSAKNFNGVDYDQRRKDHEIIEFAGHDWAKEVDSENVNYDYLMGANLDFNVPETVEQLEKWGQWFTETTKIDGFRLDAVKHIEFDYFKDWILARRKQIDPLKDPFVVGEYWSRDLGKLLWYLDSSGNVLDLFDVPLHFNLYEAATSDGAFDMRGIFNGTLAAARPDYAVTFVDNHDTQEGQALQSWIPGWFKEQANALILLRNAGTPVVFYGDLYGVPARGVNPVGKGLEAMLKLRKSFESFEQVDYFDHPDIIGWTVKSDQIGFAVILTNRTGGSKWMTIGAEFAGKTYVDVLGHRSEKIVLNDVGRAEFPVNDGSISVWVEEGTF